jgi:bacterial/archaeal transporter family protein
VVTVLLVITTVLWGATPILEKMGLAKVDPLIGVTIRSTIVTIGLLMITLSLGKGRALLEVEARDVFLFGVSGVMAGILAMWTYYTALKAGATSKIVPISACYPLVTALLSVLILREGITLARVMGTALIVSGIWLVK